MDTFLWMQGNLVADPVQWVTASGLKVTKFRIASSGRRFDNASGGWIDTEVVYMSVNCWKQLGLNVLQSLHKGDTVVVGGRLRFREYDAAEGGGRRQAYEIDASSVGPDLARYVGTFGKPLRELPDGDAPAVPAQTADDPWAAPMPVHAEETAA
ncbi:MAG TPA: single-stranded DNA-binding protein [Mycobacteriales bacterium]|jgi:single-strand DNA-binding protein|nr:single-stranded DNA-binding protein [Mycobacteriales bacterium]